MQTISRPHVVLASSSAWRAELLGAVGLTCEMHPPGLDESACEEARPVERALTLARQKLALVAPLYPESLVIAADQVAHLDGRAFGKPRDAEEHFSMLCGLRGRRHELVTGVAISWRGDSRVFHETTGITFREDLRDSEIQAYVDSGEGRGCAGGYQVERLGPWLISEVSGDWFNVVGLPIPRLVGELRSIGMGLEHVATAGSVG
ncbi:MAG: Maf family protein [Myxococcota bacterium]|nr:Maf family protein [Myxococcota bacterium]